MSFEELSVNHPDWKKMKNEISFGLQSFLKEDKSLKNLVYQ
jgi:hypothetical protein